LITQPKTAVCTVITHNRIAYARTLLNSVNQQSPGVTCYALVIDPPAEVEKLEETGFEMIGLNSMGLDDMESLLFKYTPFELCCALKPTVLRHLIEELGYETVIYLDADILVLSDLNDLLLQFEAFDILVTPHLDAPFPDDGKKPDDAHVMLSGVFNLGFLGVKNSDEGRAFLHWWAGKLKNGCVQDHFNGIFVDQKYLDLAVGLFQGLGIIRDPGCNVAYWNLHNRQISRKGDQWLSNDLPLMFYHFSDFNPYKPQVLSGHQSRYELDSLPALKALFQHYCELLESHGLTQTLNKPYGYAQYSNGHRISPATRRAYLLASPKIRPNQPFEKKSQTVAFKFSVAKQWLWLQCNRVAHVLLKR